MNNHVNEINKQKSADENERRNGNQNYENCQIHGNSLSTVAIGVVVKGTLNVLDEKNYRKACLSALVNVPSE